MFLDTALNSDLDITVSPTTRCSSSKSICR